MKRLVVGLVALGFFALAVHVVSAAPPQPGSTSTPTPNPTFKTTTIIPPKTIDVNTGARPTPKSLDVGCKNFYSALKNDIAAAPILKTIPYAASETGTTTSVIYDASNVSAFNGPQDVCKASGQVECPGLAEMKAEKERVLTVARQHYNCSDNACLINKMNQEMQQFFSTNIAECKKYGQPEDPCFNGGKAGFVKPNSRVPLFFMINNTFDDDYKMIIARAIAGQGAYCARNFQNSNAYLAPDKRERTVAAIQQCLDSQ